MVKNPYMGFKQQNYLFNPTLNNFAKKKKKKLSNIQNNISKTQDLSLLAVIKAKLEFHPWLNIVNKIPKGEILNMFLVTSLYIKIKNKNSYREKCLYQKLHTFLNTPI